MKFSDGCWSNKEGYDFLFPMEVNYTEIKENELVLYAPFKKTEHRGMTLNVGMMTVTLSSPMKDVIKVNMVHNLGAVNNGPEYDIHTENTKIKINDNDEEVEFISGNIKAVINKNRWEMKFIDIDTGEIITKSDHKSISYIRTQLDENRYSGHKDISYISEEKEKTYVREQLSIDVGELIYGLGERFTPFVKNGQTVDIWNEDGGTGSEQAYKNIPFYISNKGYGVFVNEPERVSFEIASEKVSKTQFSVQGESLEYFIINGPSIKEVLKKYTDLTGKGALPPAWSFGLWLSTSFLTNYDEKTVNEFIDGMRDRDIPLDVFHFDCFWMKEFEWSNLKWDERMFPDPKAMLKRLKEKNLKICLWINPYIAQKSYLFEEGKKHGYLVKKPDGSIWQWDRWQAGMGLVDFTNPKACEWFQNKLEELIDMGVDSFKTDFGERIPTNVVYFDGSNPFKMHNYYTHIYNKTVFDLLEKKLGKSQAVVFARSATVGGQQFPVHWGGDNEATYSSMAETLRGGLSFGLSGFSFWSHDIGGFESAGYTSSGNIEIADSKVVDIYKRWTQFGLLSSHSRYHGSDQYKVPWVYDEEAVEVTRKFTKLKCSLMPYIFKNSIDSVENGLPLMRPMLVEFMEDETCHNLDRQYMFGEDILVAPIFNENGKVKYYLPKGKWTNYLDNRVLEGGEWHTETHEYTTLPLMVRENTLIVEGSINNTTVYNYGENPIIHIFELVDKAKTEIFDLDAKKIADITVIKEGNKINVMTDLKNKYSIILRNISEVKSINNNIIKTELGIKIEVNGGDFEIEL